MNNPNRDTGNPNEVKDNPNKDDFERMVQLAEFGAKRHDERRVVEFRIFIAYNTLLVLAFYQLAKIEALKAPGWVTVGLVLIHVVYLLWQIRLSRALINDGWRRNFYLKKAECILHHLRENPSDPFGPRKDVCVTITLGDEVDKESKCPEKGKISEYELFKMPEPNIILVSPMWKVWKHWTQIYKDWSRLFQTVIPTVMLILLMGKLIGGYWTLAISLMFIDVFSIFIVFEETL